MTQLHSTDSWEQWRREKQVKDALLPRCATCDDIILKSEMVYRFETVAMDDGPSYDRIVNYHFACEEAS